MSNSAATSTLPTQASDPVERRGYEPCPLLQDVEILRAQNTALYQRNAALCELLDQEKGDCDQMTAINGTYAAYTRMLEDQGTLNLEIRAMEEKRLEDIFKIHEARTTLHTVHDLELEQRIKDVERDLEASDAALQAERTKAWEERTKARE